MSFSKLTLGILSNVGIFGLSLFLPARTLDWWRAWVFLGVIFVAGVAGTISLNRANHGLLEERFKPLLQRGQPRADKILVLLLVSAFMGVVVFIPLDVFRFHLLNKPGELVSSFGLVLFVVGWWIMILAMLENAFAAPVIKLQEERGQKVVSSGVYSVVRHPMYAGAFLFLIGMPLWLESYAAAIAALVPLAILVIRILVEERFLKRGLTGYDAYQGKVRYRLIPYLW